MPSQSRHLIIDDEINIRKTLALFLEGEGDTVTCVSNAQDALHALSQNKYDLAFLDMRLGASSGLDIIPQLLKASPWLKIIVITAYATIDNAVEAMRRGAFDYLPKPFSPPQVLAAVQRAAAVRALEQRVEDLEAQLDKGQASFHSHSLLMQKVLDLAQQAAGTDASILITGENGTGKSMLAKAIHQWSPRAKKTFGTVSCPSLSIELLESELFGHVKGAFTGALRHYPGRIAACEGGTLFLDEVGDLPLGLQAKLLRFLQDREYEHVGDNTTHRADVRIIAATNSLLSEAVKAGRFREDLFYRLDVIRLSLPPLRDRPDDILVLAEKFLIALRRDKAITGFSDQALATLRAHRWPGNIRELRNVIERAVILCPGALIEERHLNFGDTPPSPPSQQVGDMISLEALEEQHIRRVVAASRSMEDAARVLGIDTATLWRRRKKYGL